MSRPRLLVSIREWHLALAVESVARVREPGSTWPLPGAQAVVRGLAACSGRVNLVLNSDLLLAEAQQPPPELHDAAPLWLQLNGRLEGIILQVSGPLTFSSAGSRTPCPPALGSLCRSAESHGDRVAGLLHSRRLLAAVQRCAGPLAQGAGPSQVTA